MALEVSNISQADAELLLNISEGQFSDIKAKEITPTKLAKTISAFANSDGGDLYIGIGEQYLGGGIKKRTWDGFIDVEAANGHIQAFERLFPLGNDFQYEFLTADAKPGVVLHVQVARTQAVVNADEGFPFVRRGAASLPVKTPEQLKRLEYAKGVVSFENESVNAPKDVVTSSPVTANFLNHVVPAAQPEHWLRKQMLIRDERPTVAGVLLFAEEPQAILPKRCGVKIYRYKTREDEGFRDALAFDPVTIEGSIYSQIRDSVSMAVETTQSIPRLGAAGLENIRYPYETLHEIITNALIHRDYSIADDVHIRIFDNRIEIRSPGRLPAHVTVKKILDERFARNGAIVRILNKFPDPPNKDVGEGLNTAFAKMNELGLKAPQIEELDNDVLVTIRHEALASPEEAIMKYLEENETIQNKKAREITNIRADYQMKAIFNKMQAIGLIEQVPNTRTSNTAYRKKG